MVLGIPELTEEQIETISQEAEKAARRHILSKIHNKLVDKLFITIEAEGNRPVDFAVEVNLLLKPEARNVDEKMLANQAVTAAFEVIEKNLRKLKCHSTT